MRYMKHIESIKFFKWLCWTHTIYLLNIVNLLFSINKKTRHLKRNDTTIHWQKLWHILQEILALDPAKTSVKQLQHTHSQQIKEVLDVLSLVTSSIGLTIILLLFTYRYHTGMDLHNVLRLYALESCTVTYWCLMNSEKIDFPQSKLRNAL